MPTHRAARFLIAALFVTVCGCGALPEAEAPQTLERAVAVPTNHTITVNFNGSFYPSTLDVLEGDSVTFTRSGIAGPLPLTTTDAIVQATQAELLAATDSGTACMSSTLPYDITQMLPGDVNELTGPLRRGASGIYALGPEGADGYYEGAAAASCDAIGADAGALPADGGELWISVTVPDAGTQLCRKYFGDKVSNTNSRFLLQSTWNSPDLAGAVVRINWADLYTQTVSGNVITVVPDYSKLDTELDNAARRGKVVFLEVLAGAGLPGWLFPADAGVTVNAAATGIDAGSVVPIRTRDFGSDTEGSMPNPNSCGYDKTMGSPADPAYQAAVLQMLRELAAHIRAKAGWYQALGSLKVTGLNFLTGEMRLPKRCLNPRLDDNQRRCWCNTRIWATPLRAPVFAYEVDAGTDAGLVVMGGGYTEQAAQSFMTAVENTLYIALGRRKTMHFMLIQDGFPKVLDATHYEMESGTVSPNLGYVNADGSARRYDQQTVDALDRGQLGLFRKLFSDGGPDTDAGDPDAPALFSPMHAGLGPVPLDGGVNACKHALAASVVNGKLEAAVVGAGGRPTDIAQYASSPGACPNRWAVTEGYQGQLIGFQTKNTGDVVTADDLSASLWNGTLNSNMVFLEAYEVVLWKARTRGTAPLSVTDAGYADVPERQKSLGQWAAELHRRRRTIAGFPENAPNRHLKDPFPDSYTFHFDKPLAPNQVESHFFTNPAARCAFGTLSSGRINVTGK